MPSQLTKGRISWVFALVGPRRGERQVARLLVVTLAPVVAAALVGILTWVTPAIAAVFGQDDRTAVPQRLESVSQRLGLLFNNQTRTVCSAFCVSENMIATAAHCVGRGQPKAPRYQDFTFARNYGRNTENAKIEGLATGSAAQNVLTGDFKLRVRPPIDAAFDWAIIKLQGNGCPMGGLAVRAMAAPDLIAEADAGRIFQVSYHRDWARWRPAYSKPCTVGRDFETAKWSAIAPDFLSSEQMILHTCDTGGASSGSPLLLETADGPVVVGINVGTYVQSKIVTQNGKVSMRQKSETVANTAVSATVFAAKIEMMKNATILPSGRPMRDLQQQLRVLGHYNGPADGAYGPAVKAAIEAYEKAHRQPVTGLATRPLLMMATEEAAPGNGQLTPSSAPQLPSASQLPGAPQTRSR